eukprot:tig00021435_g21432.t1
MGPARGRRVSAPALAQPRGSDPVPSPSTSSSSASASAPAPAAPAAAGGRPTRDELQQASRNRSQATLPRVRSRSTSALRDRDDRDRDHDRPAAPPWAPLGLEPAAASSRGQSSLALGTELPLESSTPLAAQSSLLRHIYYT